MPKAKGKVSKPDEGQKQHSGTHKRQEEYGSGDPSSIFMKPVEKKAKKKSNSPKHEKSEARTSEKLPAYQQEQQPGPPQTQGAQQRGPQPGQFPELPQQQQPGSSQTQGAWSRGPQPEQFSKHQQQQQQQQPGSSQTQGAWSRGPQPEQFSKQQQQQPPGSSQTQGAWSRGPQPEQFSKHQQQQQQQQPGSPQTQGAWSRGPQPEQFSKHQQQQQPGSPQTQGAQQRGPQPGQFPELPQQQQPGSLKKQKAQQRGPQPEKFSKHHQQQQQQQPGSSQTQGAWSRGPQPEQFSKHQQQQQQQQPGSSQTQGAWSRGPQPEQFSKHQQQQQQQQPGSSQTQGAWSRGPQPEQSRAISATSISASSTSSGELDIFTEPSVYTSFTKRICAPKKSGRKIVVSTNYFPLHFLKPNVTVVHYNVVIEPEKPSYLLRTVFNRYISLVFPGRLVAFDGKRNAFTKGPLLKEMRSNITNVTVNNPDNNREKEFKVYIEEVRKVSFSALENYWVKSPDEVPKVLPEAELTVLEIIMKSWALDNFIKSGRSFFPSSAKNPKTVSVTDKISMRIGYFQAVSLGCRPFLNFDIAHKAFYNENYLLDIIKHFENRRTREINFDELNRFLGRVKIKYELPNDPSSFRLYRVNKLVGTADRQTFKKDDGKEMTVAQYFAKEKKCKLHHPELPLLWVGPTQKSIYVPMEFCKIAPDQVFLGQLDRTERITTSSDARKRQKDTYDLLKMTNLNSHPLMKEFEIKVSEDMEQVSARVLDPPGLRTAVGVKVNEGVWRIRNFLEPVTLKKWCVLNLDRRVQRETIIFLQNMIKNKGNELNMSIGEPAINYVEANPFKTAELKKTFSNLKDMDIVFVIISEDKGVYSKVKVICETEQGILTQCLKSRTVQQDPRKFMMTVENILLKVNAKLGGKNHILDKNSFPRCLDGHVMIIGADVTHPSPGMKIPSVAAVTISCDPVAFQYETSTRVQPKGEIIRDLQEIIVDHVKKYYKLRKNYPEKIIFFRDGVSEGEMAKVFKEELGAVKKACAKYCNPKITFIVVQKRHHTRFYATRPEDAQNKNFNVPVGTCVDTDIVHPKDLEFYLISHYSILGTARPTKYRLLYDDNKLTDDELERLAYYLCHLFARCNRSVSYPSPTYYAHLAAARVRAYLESLDLSVAKDITDIQKLMPDRISNVSPMFYV